MGNCFFPAFTTQIDGVWLIAAVEKKCVSSGLAAEITWQMATRDRFLDSE